ncbi:MAG: hypothetical protein J6Y70_00625 [Bacilli bacterium]|nr:hypothetical protein [Bacilli bacterium]
MSAFLETQPIICKLFLNALKKNKVAHNYLLCGENEAYLKNAAFFLSASLICDNPSPLACEKCDTCLKVKHNNYPDLIFIDGSKEIIKKENTNYIFKKFLNFSINEKKNKNICILHLIENMTAEASNAFLKFFEEPPKNSFIFLTTTNEKAILPTIISRCQKIYLYPDKYDKLIKFCLNNNIEIKNAEILSLICKNIYDIKNIYNDDFYNIKNACIVFLNCIKNKKDLIFITNFSICKYIKNKQQAMLFFDIIIAFLRDVLYKKINQKIYLQSYQKLIFQLSSTLKNIDNLIEEIEIFKKDLYLNINITNILEHLAVFIIKNNIK